MPPARFSSEIVSASTVRSCPTQACSAKTRFESIWHRPQIQRPAHDAAGIDDDAAEEAAGERRREPVDLHDRRDLGLGEAELDVEGVGHGAEEGVAELVEGDEEKDERRLARPGAAEEVGERLDDRLDDPLARRSGASRSAGTPVGSR